MWRVLRAELAYTRIHFLVFLVFIPLLLVFGVFRPSASALYAAWLATFLMVNTWNASRIREKRELQLAQLPVSATQLALVRVFMITVPPAAILLLYVILHPLAEPNVPIPVRGLLTLYGLIVLVYSLALMFRDRFLGTRFLKQGKILIVTLIAAGIAANVAAFYVFRRASEEGAEPPAILRAVDYLVDNNPSTTNLGTGIFMAICLGCVLLSIATFKRRRTHLE